ncbi:hypothetical protein CH75_23385 [Dyella jiangningensis]|nr:hypothetical protein CH75_00300 [Dyella jiangningensis]AHX16481.1 hypothetical protein CH75_23385 [Dyella jiangningensis]
MHDCVEASGSENVVQCRRVQKVRLDEGAPLHGTAVARRQIVEHGHGMAMSGEHLRHMAADVTRATTQ